MYNSLIFLTLMSFLPGILGRCLSDHLSPCDGTRTKRCKGAVFELRGHNGNGDRIYGNLCGYPLALCSAQEMTHCVFPDFDEEMRYF